MSAKTLALKTTIISQPDISNASLAHFEIPSPNSQFILDVRSEAFQSLLGDLITIGVPFIVDFNYMNNPYLALVSLEVSGSNSDPIDGAATNEVVRSAKDDTSTI
ncbi:MAG: hypothetical protein AAF388_13190, partial [Bacteroidota bacterium]